MSVKVADADIYNADGVLLIAKGQQLTDEVVGRLQRLCIEKAMQSEQLAQSRLQEFKNIYLRHKNAEFNTVSQIVSEEIFSSKSRPWWVSINALSNYVDWVYTHSIDVALISLTIANQLKCSRAKMHEICLGALLHDIGKMLIPKHIIEKPGKLSEQEKVLVRQHCELGGCIVKGFGLPKSCTDIILQHHERLDGSGYPYGLTENQISGEAKIVMIADVLDAMTSYRPYKPAKAMNAAIDDLMHQPEKLDTGYLKAWTAAMG